MTFGMKKTTKNKIWNGVPSAVLLSILIHAALFLFAGMLVVFTVVKQKEVEFVPPKAVERPKMKLKKPKVKVKKSAKPKSTQRIVSQMKSVEMPDIQLPEMTGMGEGLGAGIGGFDMMPDFNEVSVFGGGQSVGNDFVGTFYDFKRDRRGRNVPMDPSAYVDKLASFVRHGWKDSELARYYQSPKKLYATTFLVPRVLSTIAPEAFGEPDAGGWCWAVHYKGELVHKDGITFRFWGHGDDVLVVRVDGRVVLAANWIGGKYAADTIASFWQSDSADSYKYYMGNNTSVVGDWITLEPGVPLDMEVLLGEGPGGGFCAMLAVEVKGVEYERGPQGNPILPIFKTAVPSLNLVEAIRKDLVPKEVCVTNGPVFSDYDTSPVRMEAPALEPSAPPRFVDSVKERIRTWMLQNGKSVEARFVTTVGGMLVLEDSRGRQKKIPMERISDEDRKFVELAQPPVFNIDFIKKSSQRFFKESPYIEAGWVPDELDYIFGARLKQTSAGEYDHELKVEFFAIGDELEGDNFVLLDRQESYFTPAKENGFHEFRGDVVPVREIRIERFQQDRGVKYGGYLVVVTDERGVIIDYATSNKWMLSVLENLRRLPLGKHFDKTGKRIFPPSPKPYAY